jgi:Fe-S-cluster formation regulator IscX/YfhJ
MEYKDYREIAKTLYDREHTFTMKLEYKDDDGEKCTMILDESEYEYLQFAMDKLIEERW